VQKRSFGNYVFNVPAGLVFDGTDIWVANLGGNSVTELDASDGSWVQALTLQ
jgi:hypothetical protein